jgi:hypothetical protein
MFRYVSRSAVRPVMSLRCSFGLYLPVCWSDGIERQLDIEQSCNVKSQYGCIATRRKRRNGVHLTKTLYITDVASDGVISRSSKKNLLSDLPRSILLSFASRQSLILMSLGTRRITADWLLGSKYQ